MCLGFSAKIPVPEIPPPPPPAAPVPLPAITKTSTPKKPYKPKLTNDLTIARNTLPPNVNLGGLVIPIGPDNMLNWKQQ